MSLQLDGLVSLASSPWVWELVDLFAKSTVVLLFACIATFLARHASAALRHRIWCLAFVSLLLLPVFAALLPSWRLPILPDIDPVAAELESEPAAQEELIEPALPAEFPAPPVPWETAHGGFQEQSVARFDVSSDDKPWHEMEATAETAPVFVAQAPEVVPATTAAAARYEWSYLFLSLWVIGFGVTFLPVVVSLLHNYFVGRSAKLVGDTEGIGLLSSLCHTLDLERSVLLLESDRPIVPMTWGVLRPIVLFPVTWRAWTHERRRFVLLHELAHVKRYDVAFQLIARLACGLYWFHPLCWYALRRLRIERELACDDCVLMTGERPSAYARQLVAIARSYRMLTLPAAVAMVQTTSLEKRVRSLLDRARSHVPISPSAARTLLAATMVIVMGVAAVRPAVMESRADEETVAGATAEEKEPPAARSTELESEPASDAATEEVAAEVAAEAAAKPDAVESMTLHYRGQVVDPQGEPVEGAKVWFVYWVHGALPTDRAEPRAVTDAEGWFDFQASRSDFEPEADEVFLNCGIVATAPGYGFAQSFSVLFEKTGQAMKQMPSAALIYLKELYKNPKRQLQLVDDDAPIEGRIVTVDGEPVKDARLQVDRLWFNGDGSLDAWEAAAKEEKADFYSLRRTTPLAFNGPQLPSLLRDVTTDADGRFTFRGIGRERVVQMRVYGPGIESSTIKCRTRQGETIVLPHQWPGRSFDLPDERYFGARFTHVAGPSKPIVGRITDAASGDPISGVTISAGHQGSFTRGGKPWIAARSDEQGRYRLEGLPVGGDDRLYIFPPEDSGYLPAGRPVNSKIDQPQVTLDFQLSKGIWVRGRVVDDRTGEPQSGRVSYYGDPANEHLESYRGFSRLSTSYETRAQHDGSFAIPVPPGRGVLTVTPDDHGSYRRGVGASTITIPARQIDGDGQSYRTVPTYLHSFNERLLQEIRPAVGSGPLEVTLALSSGVDVEGRVVDVDGTAVTDCIWNGGINPGAWYPMRNKTFLVEGYYADRPRDLFFYEPSRNLASHFLLEGKPPKDLLVTLRKAGSVRGRLVDDDGAPISNLELSGEGVPGENFGDAALRLSSDEGGRFLIHGLIPGRKYTVVGHGDRRYGRVLVDVSVEAGQTKDVGDVPLQTGDFAEVFESPAAPAKKSTQVNVRGTVVLPDGKPAAGAIVRAAAPMYAMLKPLVGDDFEPPVSEVKADAEGRFSIAVSRQPFGDLSRLETNWQETWKRTAIAASLPGYGPSWIEYKEIESDKPVTLRLVKDLPIQGRVIDLEGAPVTGLTIQVGGPNAAEDEDLSNWLRAAQAGELPWTLYKHLPHSVEPKVANLPSQVTTDDQGRFEIRGIGRERRISLVFESATVAHRSVSVVTRKMDPIERAITTTERFGNPKETVFGAEFTFTAAPSRPIVGTVRDAKTGAPMPGVAVESYKMAGYPYSNHRVLKTVTDQEGRFRLVGMPKAEGNRLLVLPNDEQPYFMRRVDVPDPPGLEPAEVDIELHRGIWIQGHVTDKATGEPVYARVYFLPFRTNEFAQTLPEFDDDGNVDGDQLRYRTKADGSYRLVGLPGPAIVGASSHHKHYREGVGYETVNGPKYRDTDYFDTYRNPLNPSPKWPNVMRQINASPAAESMQLDLQMDPGASVPIVIVDPDGQPATGVEVTGQWSSNSATTLETDRFNAVNFGPQETRTILLHHKTRDLGWVARVGAGSAKPEPILVTLQSCATLTGKLLHKDGTPLTGAKIDAWPLPSGDFAKRLPSVTTDTEGRFRMKLLPGAAYSLQAEGAALEVAGIVRMLTVDPGETKDVGVLRLADERRFETIADTEQPMSALATIHGLVLDPDGNPVRQGRVSVREPLAKEWTLFARTDNQGKFRASLDRSRLDAALEKAPNTTFRIAATARGLGFAWNDVKVAELGQEIRLQMVKDVPIDGRIVTTDGQGAAGVTLTVRYVQSGGPHLVDRYLDARRESMGIFYSVPVGALNQGPPGLDRIVTDAEGRFQATGLGAERIVRFQMIGTGLSKGWVDVITRPSAENQASGAALLREPPRVSSYFASFTHIAPAGRIIRGVVRDGQTGQPVSEAVVGVWPAIDEDRVTTGLDGRFEISGCLKSDQYSLAVRVLNEQHFNRKLKIRDTDGLDPLDVEVDLVRGRVCRGRVTDKETGKPANGWVAYNPLYPNPNVDVLGESIADQAASSAKIRPDGTFEIPVLPGPGVLGVENPERQYLSADVDPEELRELVGKDPLAGSDVQFLSIAAGGQSMRGMSIGFYKALALINPKAKEEQLALVELQLVRGHDLKGTVVDPLGQPIIGVIAAGLRQPGVNFEIGPLESADFTVTGLAAGQQRTLLFYHRERNLGGVSSVGGENTEPLTVQLRACGTATGRIVDDLGDPVADMQLEFCRTSPTLIGTQTWITRTDRDGRFRMEGLIAGFPYYVSTRLDGEHGSLGPDHITVESDGLKNLGQFVRQANGLFTHQEKKP